MSPTPQCIASCGLTYYSGTTNGENPSTACNGLDPFNPPGAECGGPKGFTAFTWATASCDHCENWQGIRGVQCGASCEYPACEDDSHCTDPAFPVCRDGGTCAAQCVAVCGGKGDPCCPDGSCNGALWCDDLLPFTHTNLGSIHGAPAPGLCCRVGEVAWDVAGTWICEATDPCGPETPTTNPPEFPADDEGQVCSMTQACCADIIQKGPSSYESMCIPLGSLVYTRDFYVY